MATAMTISTPMTVEQLLALPDDGTERWLIHGELREKEMTVRNRFHSRIMIVVGSFLEAWTRSRLAPARQVLGGEAGFILKHDPATIVGIDVAYISAELAAKQTNETTLIDGAPELAVEILSPSDTNQEINEKIDVYLTAGVKLVWIIDPHRKTVTVYHSTLPVRTYSGDELLSFDDVLPGFSVKTGDLFT